MADALTREEALAKLRAVGNDPSQPTEARIDALQCANLLMENTTAHPAGDPGKPIMTADRLATLRPRDAAKFFADGGSIVEPRSRAISRAEFGVAQADPIRAAQLAREIVAGTAKLVD